MPHSSIVGSPARNGIGRGCSALVLEIHSMQSPSDTPRTAAVLFRRISSPAAVACGLALTIGWVVLVGYALFLLVQVI
jgi:hypothetical protein